MTPFEQAQKMLAGDITVEEGGAKQLACREAGDEAGVEFWRQVFEAYVKIAPKACDQEEYNALMNAGYYAEGCVDQTEAEMEEDRKSLEEYYRARYGAAFPDDPDADNDDNPFPD